MQGGDDDEEEDDDDDDDDDDDYDYDYDYDCDHDDDHDQDHDDDHYHDGNNFPYGKKTSSYVCGGVAFPTLPVRILIQLRSCHHSRCPDSQALLIVADHGVLQNFWEDQHPYSQSNYVYLYIPYIAFLRVSTFTILFGWFPSNIQEVYKSFNSCTSASIFLAPFFPQEVPDSARHVQPVEVWHSQLKGIPSPETNSSHLNIGGWEMKSLLGFRPIFQGRDVSFREGIVGLGSSE